MKAPKLTVKRYKHSDTSRFVVDGLRINGKRVRSFFPTRREAETFAAQKQIQLENLGLRALEMPDALRVMAIECADRLKPFRKTLADATAHYVDYLKSCERSCTVKELVAEFIASKQSKGKSDRYLKDLRYRLGRFEGDFADKIAATVTTAQIDDWICGLGQSSQSQNNFRAVLSSLFSYAVSRGYAKDNPVARVERVKVVGDAPEILTPEQTARLLEAATTDALAFLTIGAFAGLRVAETMRLDWRDVDLDGGFIEVTAKKAKSAKRRLVRILPNLAAWLRPLARTHGPVCPPNLRRHLLETRTRAGLAEWPANALRHSFASYHLAKFNDAARLALEMGHTDTSMIFSHYRELVKPADAERYWNIAPAADGAEKIVTLAAAGR
jgi:integrase